MSRWFVIVILGLGLFVGQRGWSDPNSLLPRPPRPAPKAGGDPIHPSSSEVKPGSLSVAPVTLGEELKPISVPTGRLEVQNLSNSGIAPPEGAALGTNSVWQTTNAPSVLAPVQPPPDVWTPPPSSPRPDPWTTPASVQGPNPWTTPPRPNLWQPDATPAGDWWKPATPAHSWPETTPRGPAK